MIKKNSCYFNSMKWFPTALSLLILTACGGGSGGSDPKEPGPEAPESANVAILAQDVTTAVYEKVPSVISLASSIEVSDGSAPILMDVTPITEAAECKDFTINSGTISFTLNGKKDGLCVYKYTVTDSNGDVTTEAFAQVAINATGAPLVSSNNLTPLSAVTAVGANSIDISLEAPTMTDSTTGLPIEFTLSTNLTTMGSGVATANVGTGVTDPDTGSTTGTDSITYTPGTSAEDAGITRIFYSYSSADGMVLVGTVDVAVSTDMYNQAPKAQSWTYVENDDLRLGKTYTSIREGQEVVVDLTNVYVEKNTLGSLISDGDLEDELQLVNLQVFNANADYVDETDLDNKSFTFSADQAGSYYVSYTISDHKGGYSAGLIEFKVEGTWPNVIVESTGDVFSAPLSLEAASVANYDVSGVAQEAARPNGNGYDNVPTYTWSAANAICRARGGSLPTLAEAQAFLTQEQNPFVVGDGTADEMASEWPVARGYFTSHFVPGNPNQVLVMRADSDNLIFEPVSSGEDGVSEPYLGYLFCIDKTPQSISIDNKILVMDMDQHLKASFNTASGMVFPYTGPLYWYVSEPEDTSLEAMPNIDANITLNKVSGDFYAINNGFINVRVETPLGDLSDDRDIEVIQNLLAKDADLTFETYPAESESCDRDLLAHEDYWSVNIFDKFQWYVFHDCDDAPEGTNYISVLYPAYPSTVQIQSLDTGADMTQGQEYALTMWVRWYEGIGGTGNSTLRDARIKGNDSDGNKRSIGGCQLVNAYNVFNTDIIVSGTGHKNKWTKVSCKFTPDDDYTGIYFELTNYEYRTDLDDIMLVPVTE